MPRYAIATEDDEIKTSASTVAGATEFHDSDESLFEQVAWLYAFCRERLFEMTPIG